MRLRAFRGRDPVPRHAAAGAVEQVDFRQNVQPVARAGLVDIALPVSQRRIENAVEMIDQCDDVTWSADAVAVDVAGQ